MVRRFDLCPSATSIANGQLSLPPSHWPVDQNTEKNTTVLALPKLLLKSIRIICLLFN